MNVVGGMVVFLICFVSGVIFGQDSLAETRALLLQTDQESYELGGFLQVLEDKTGEWDIAAVTSEPYANQFASVTSKTVNLGMSESAFWFRFSVSGSVNEPKRQGWFLQMDRKRLTHCELFIPEIPGDPTQSPRQWRTLDGNHTSGFRKLKSFCPMPIAIPLPSLAPEQTTFYLRVHNPGGGLYLPLSIVTEDALRVSMVEKALWHGIYYGTMLAMLLFNFYLYVSLRETIQVYYIFYIGSVVLYFLFSNDILLPYFADVDFYRRMNVFVLGLTIFWGTFFAKSFLNTKEHVKHVDRFLVAIIIAAAGVAVASLFSGMSMIFLNSTASLLGMMSPLFIILAGVIRWRKGFRPILFFIVGWSLLCIGGLVYALTYRGTLPYSALTFYGFQIGSCLEVVILSFALGERMRSLRRERDSIKRIFGKYVSDKVCDEILSGRIPLDGESKQVTVLISDLRNYTPLVESTPPKKLVRIINTYFEAMVRSIEKHKGLVLQYAGDSIQAVFGAPLPLENHPEMALRAALEMRQQLNQVNEKLASEGCSSLSHGIGIHSGKVTAANIGSPDRLSYALSGLAVNLASRIETLNKQFGTDVLVSETTMSQVRSEIKVESLGLIPIRGLREPLEIFKVLCKE